jgi:hypothetical protein
MAAITSQFCPHMPNFYAVCPFKKMPTVENMDIPAPRPKSDRQ